MTIGRLTVGLAVGLGLVLEHYLVGVGVLSGQLLGGEVDILLLVAVGDGLACLLLCLPHLLLPTPLHTAHHNNNNNNEPNNGRKGNPSNSPTLQRLLIRIIVLALGGQRRRVSTRRGTVTVSVTAVLGTVLVSTARVVAHFWDYYKGGEILLGYFYSGILLGLGKLG